MPIEIDSKLLTFKNWTFRLRMPQVKPRRLLILIHGWMGDENSMGVFAHNISPDVAILAPRGIVAVPEGGYSWREIKPGTWGTASLDEFRSAADAMVTFVDEWSASAGLDENQFDLMGFSQGAALTYTLALLYPQRIRRLAALSGFIPAGGSVLLAGKDLSGKPVFISHGRQDDTIPVEQSRQAAAQLQLAGAQVTYCESDAGHKVSKDCLKELLTFFEKN